MNVWKIQLTAVHAKNGFGETLGEAAASCIFPMFFSWAFSQLWANFCPTLGRLWADF